MKAKPNPWHAFLRSGLGNGLTNEQRKIAYDKFKQEYLAQNESIASYAPLRRYLVGLRERVRQNQIFYTKECDIELDLLRFFDAMVATRILGTTLTPCELIGVSLLRKCVPMREVKYYNFKKALGFGNYGFVFQCTYKARETRAVKMVIVGDTDDVVHITANRRVKRVKFEMVRREFSMHCRVLHSTNTSSGVRALRLHGNLAIFKPSRFKDLVGVYIMDQLPVPVLADEIREAGISVPESILRKVEAMPCAIADLQQKGFAHSDLHHGNIAFDPHSTMRPYIIDFARTVELDITFHNNPLERALYCAIEYTVPLWAFLHLSPSSKAVTLYNRFIVGMNIRRIYAAVDHRTLLYISSCLKRVFKPVQDVEIEVRKGQIRDLLLTKIFVHKTQTFLDLAHNGIVTISRVYHTLP